MPHFFLLPPIPCLMKRLHVNWECREISQLTGQTLVKNKLSIGRNFKMFIFFDLGNDFLGYDPKNTGNKSKTQQIGFHQINKLQPSKRQNQKGLGVWLSW
jgi:hypothetical protein